MSNYQLNQSNQSNKSKPSSPRSRRGSNPFSDRISSILQLRQQIVDQQQALSDKLEKDWKRLESSVAPQISTPAFHDMFADCPDVVISNGPNRKKSIDLDDIEIMPEPDCPFFDEAELDQELTSDNDTNSDDTENKYESDAESESDKSESDKFAVTLDIYQRVSYNNFDFHHWLKQFDLICIKEILVFHNLQLKEMWTQKNFEQIYRHPLIKRDRKLLSQMKTMLNIFNSLKRKELTGKGVWESDNNNNNTATTTNEPSFIHALLRQHFKNPDSNIVPYKGLNFKVNKMPAMPPMPPMGTMGTMPSMPMNLQYHFN